MSETVESLYGRGLTHRPDLREVAEPFKPKLRREQRIFGWSVQQFDRTNIAQWYANVAPAYWEPRGQPFLIVPVKA